MMRIFIFEWTMLLTIQKFAPSQKCFYTLLLRHYFEVHESVRTSSCPWTHKSISHDSLITRVASLSFPPECARHGGTDRSHRCETSLLGHSTHASAAGYCATQCVHAAGVMSWSLWALYSVHQQLFSLKWNMTISEEFNIIRNVHESVWEYFLDAFNWPISLQRHCMTHKYIFKRTMWPLHNITFDGKVLSWTGDQVVSLMSYWMASGNGKHIYLFWSTC